MDILKLEQLIRGSATSIDENYIKSLLLPCIDIVEIEAEIKVGCSKLGGIPDIPNGFELPAHEYGNYRFIAQFNLGEISQANLPTKGLLSFFVADDAEQQYFWGNDGYAKVFFFPEIDTLHQCSLSNVQPCIPIRLESSMSLPWERDLLKNVDMTQEQIEEFLDDIFYEINFNMNYLLGYPFYNTLAYDPRPDEDWTSLLTLRSIDELDWCWHDGDKLMLFIEKDKLAQSNFSNIKSDAG